MYLVKVKEEPTLWSELGHLAAGGVLASVPYHLLSLIPNPTFVISLLSCVLGSTILFMAMARGARGTVRLLPGLTSSVLAGIALAFLMPVSPALAILAFGGFLGMARASGLADLGTKLTVIGTTAVSALVASLVFGQLILAFAAVPFMVKSLALAGVFGAFVGLGGLPAHVEMRPDRIGAKYRHLINELRSEIKDYVYRAMALHGKILKSLESRMFAGVREQESFERALEDLTLRIFSLCETWHDLENHLVSFRITEVKGRALMIEEKKRGSKDDETKVQYDRTLQALEKRCRDHEEVTSTRDRLVSNLTYNFTAMEDLYYELVKTKSAGALEATSDLDRLARTVSNLSEELNATRSSVEEISARLHAEVPARVENL